MTLLGPSRTADALPVSSLIGSLPANQRVLQISGSATGRQLSDHSAHPSFFRVIPSDQTQVQVMIRLMLQLQWNYVAIVYDDDDYGRSAATELRRLAEKHQVCVPVFVSLPVDARSSAFVKQAKNISQQLRSTMNGLVRGLVVLGATSTTQKLLRIISSDIAFVSVILSEAVDLNRATLLTSGGQVSAVSAGALVTSPPFIDLPELKPLWNDLWSNGTSFLEQAGKIPWLGEYFTQLSSCSADDSTTCWSQAETQRQIQKVSEEAEVPLYVGYQVKAVAVMVTLLKHLQEEKCGSASSGLCSGLVTTISQRTGIIETLEDSTLNVSNLSAVSDVFKGLTSVRFSGSSSSLLSDGAKGDYTVFNFRRPEKQGDFNFEQIGSWLNNNLTINTSRAQFYDETLLPLTWSQLPPAQCDVDHDCLKCERDPFCLPTTRPRLIHWPVERSEQHWEQISCSRWCSVDEANKKQDLFKDVPPGRRVGLVVINSCGSPQLVRRRLLDFHAGTMPLSEGRTSSSVLDRIMGYVGAVYSADSIAVSDTMYALGKPFVQISGASTSPDLSDEKKYPYFLRLHPADDKQALAVLDIVQNVGANYVQVIYDSSTSYATALYSKLQDEVATNTKYNICIAQAIATTLRDEVSQYIWIKDKLREKHGAKIVIVILHPVEIEKVLDAILPRLGTGEFIFVATETWGRRDNLIRGTHRGKLAGSLVLSVELVNDQIFKRYFQQIDPVHSINPWLKYFWEARLKCYFNKSFMRKGKPNPCPEDVTQNYTQDPLVPFHINAVYALALGFNSTLTQLCGSQATRTCRSLTSSALFSATLEVKLDLNATGRPSTVFDSKGEGLVGYKVLQISPDLDTSSEHVIYKDVGLWTRSTLIFDKTFPASGGHVFRSMCTDTKECEACFHRNGSAVKAGSGRRSIESIDVASPVFIGVVVSLVVVIVFLVVLVVWMFVRSRESLRQAARPRGVHA
ncbi:uncharacterized protein [Littorina saxatilis]|uniref:uncharacterized protein n=1 Tax=Littorina saxatilis TaxID=31220 RepID=UPI0038B5EEFB